MKRIENGYWLGKWNRCGLQSTFLHFLSFFKHMLQFSISCHSTVMFSLLKCLSHTSTYQKFKVPFKLCFLYVAYSLTTKIYYLYIALIIIQFVLHCVHVFLLLLDCKLLRGENHASYHTAHMHIMWTSGSILHQVKSFVSTVKYHNKCYHHYFLVLCFLHCSFLIFVWFSRLSDCNKKWFSAISKFSIFTLFLNPRLTLFRGRNVPSFKMLQASGPSKQS